ncbi:MAG: GtrA family protein [Fusobacteriaceae bacterium]|jgi:putative flippase GtrA|nr:GtrA family protein [Fusobacteriaceae bacterium]
MKKKLEIIGIKNKHIEIVIQFLKFGIVGLTNTLISLIIYYTFIFFNKDLYMIGHIIGFLVSVLNAYYWNNKYVFKKNEINNFKPLIKSFIAYGSTFLLSTIMLYILINYLYISKTIAPIINLTVTIPLNFLLNKFWTFK